MWRCRQAAYTLLHTCPVVWPYLPHSVAPVHCWTHHLIITLGVNNRSRTERGRSFTSYTGINSPRTGRTTYSNNMDLDSPQTPNFPGLKDFPAIKFNSPPRVKLYTAKDELPILREKEEYHDSGIFFSSVDSTPEPREADANFVDIWSDSTEGSESAISVDEGKDLLCSPDQLDLNSDKDQVGKMQSFFSPHRPEKLTLDSLSAGPPLLDLTMLMMQPVRSAPSTPKARTVLPPTSLNTVSSTEGGVVGQELDTHRPGGDISSSIDKDSQAADSDLYKYNVTVECEETQQDENNVLGIDIFEDNLQTTTGVRNAKKRAKKRKSETSSDGKSFKKEKKVIPNYFVAVQITNPEIHTHVRTVQSHVEAASPCLRAAFISASTLHLTLHVSHLPDADHISRAKAALDECHSHVQSSWPEAHAPLLHVTGLGSFRDNVVFVNLEKNSSLDTLNKVADTVQECLLEKGIASTDARGFTPHITVMKLSKAPGLRYKGIKKINPSIYEAFRECDFGWQRVRSLQLCSMLKPKDGNGYYHVEHEVTFDLPEGEALDGSAGRIASFKPKSIVAMPVKAVVKLEKDLKWTFKVPPEHF